MSPSWHHSVLLTVVELAVGLLTVDDVEPVADGRLHSADLKVEPLVVIGGVCVGVQDQVILMPQRKSKQKTNSLPISAAKGIFRKVRLTLILSHDISTNVPSFVKGPL